LIDLGGITELVINTNGDTWDDKANSWVYVGEVISVIRFDEIRASPSPVQWFFIRIGDHTKIPIYRIVGITKLLAVFSDGVIVTVLPQFKVQPKLYGHPSNGTPYISIGNINLKSYLLLVFRPSWWMLETQRWHYGIIPASRYVDQFYPRPLGIDGRIALYASLFLHFIPHLSANVGVIASGSEGSRSSEEHSNIQKYFPPWRLVVAALVAILGTVLGWWNICRERRIGFYVLVCAVSLTLWGYAIYRFLDWSANF